MKKKRTRVSSPIESAKLCGKAGALIYVSFVLITLVAAQTPSRVQLGKTSDKELAFDYDGNATDGTPLTADAAEFLFRRIGIAPVRVLVSAAIVTGENRFQAAAVIGEVPDGDYDATVRIRGDNGNWSEETPVLQVTVSSKKPSRPGNFGERG